jgi:hypothetical protein
MCFWIESADGNASAYLLARRHYSAKKNPRPKQRQFVGPGEHMVLIGFMVEAVFAWRRAKFRKDCQRGVECSLFRNESDNLSSAMIEEAVALAWSKWPGERLFTHVSPGDVRSTNPGYCFLMAGFRKCGRTKRGKIVLERLPEGQR